MERIKVLTVTIPNNGSLSESIDLGTTQLVGIQVPDPWTAAAITFQSSADNTANSYGSVRLPSGELVIAAAEAAAGNIIGIDIHQTMALRFIKVQSGIVGTLVNQGAARTVKLIVRSTV